MPSFLGLFILVLYLARRSQVSGACHTLSISPLRVCNHECNGDEVVVRSNFGMLSTTEKVALRASASRDRSIALACVNYSNQTQSSVPQYFTFSLLSYATSLYVALLMNAREVASQYIRVGLSRSDVIVGKNTEVRSLVAKTSLSIRLYQRLLEESARGLSNALRQHSLASQSHQRASERVQRDLSLWRSNLPCRISLPCA